MKKYIDTIKDKITIEDLDEAKQDVASVIGIDNYIRLCEEFGGTSLFFPKIDGLVKKRVYKKVVELKDIMPKYQIAKMLGLSTSTVYKIINEYEGKH